MSLELRRREMMAQVAERQPNNQIWYWRENNTIATLYSSSKFLSNIVSHEKVGKKFVITFDSDLTESTDVLRGVGNLSKITLPNSIITITAYAFKDTQTKTRNNGIELVLPKNLTTINAYGLAGDLLYTFPSTLKYLGYLSCSSNYALKSITIPASVTTMATGSGNTECRVFDNCLNLSTINVEEGNEYFYSENSCLIRKSNKRLIAVPSIDEVFVPEGVKLIGYGSASAGVRNPKIIHLPSTITELQSYSFLSASSVKTIICKSINPPKMYNNTFYYTNPTAIYVPNDSVEAYKAADIWSTIADRIKPISELPQ